LPEPQHKGLFLSLEGKATLGSDLSAMRGFAGSDAERCRSFFAVAHDFDSVLRRSTTEYTVCFSRTTMSLGYFAVCWGFFSRTNYTGVQRQNTPAVLRQYSSAATAGITHQNHIII